MRILIFYAGGDRGGAKPHILTLARELSKENALRLVCFRKGETASEAAAMGIDVAAISEKESFFAAKRFALSQLRAFRADIIHCHGSKANLLGVLSGKREGIPVITTVHSDPELDYMGAQLRNISFGNANRWALRNMDYCITVASRLKDILIERNFDPQKIFTVFNAVEFEDKDYDKKPSDIVTVGIAARLDPVKDIGTLLKAFSIAYSKNKKLRLSIAGTGEEEAKLRAQVRELGIEEVTVFEGWVSDMRAYFRSVDINVLCSLSETFPYSLLEGASEFVPAIASRVGDIPSLIEDGSTGLLFEAGDAEKFAEELLLLAGDPELRKRIGIALYEKAKSEYSIARMRSDQQKIYETVLRRSARTGRQGAVICGAYGKGNAGDDAILRAIISSLQSIDEDMPIYVMSRKPKETRSQNKVNSFFIFDILKLRKVLVGARLFISGGGTLIQDVTSTRSLMFYLYALRAAKRAGVKTEMYGCGIGPIYKAGNIKKTARVLNESVDVITLRDSASLELLKDIGVTEPEMILAADPTVNLPPPGEALIERSFRAIGADPAAKKIVFCIRPWESFRSPDAIAEAAEYAYREFGLLPIFLPMEYPRDVAIGEKLGSLLSVPHIVSSKRHSIEELRAMLSNADLVVGMRLHSLVFAAAGGAPIVGISYDLKVSSFIKDSGAKRMIELEELTAERLKENIVSAITDGRAMGEETKLRLQRLEKNNVEIAARLIGEFR